jgi:hypothetical protein
MLPLKSAGENSRKIPPLCVLAHISPPDSSPCCGCDGKPSEGEETMKRSAFRGPKLPERPIARREADYAASRANAADTYDDRSSENIFDVEDERAEVDIIVHGMLHDAN